MRKCKHGLYGSPTYNTWHSMIQRCENKNNNNFKNYGAIGITVPKKWKNFKVFLSDMGERPEGLTLDRIDNSKGYSKQNCRWATKTQQQLNRSMNVYVTYRGERKLLKDWSEQTGLDRNTISCRIKRYGWTIDEAIATPLTTKGWRERGKKTTDV